MQKTRVVILLFILTVSPFLSQGQAQLQRVVNSLPYCNKEVNSERIGLWVETFNLNGEECLEFGFYSEDVRIGEWIRVAPSGELDWLFNYVDGNLNGESRKYRNDQLMASAHFKNGQPHGMTTYFKWDPKITLLQRWDYRLLEQIATEDYEEGRLKNWSKKAPDLKIDFSIELPSIASPKKIVSKAIAHLVFEPGGQPVTDFSYSNPADSVWTVFRFTNQQFRQLIISKNCGQATVAELSDPHIAYRGRYLEFFDGKLVKDFNFKDSFIDGPALIIEDGKQLTLHYTDGKIDEIPAAAHDFRQLYIYKDYCVPIADFDKKWIYWSDFQISWLGGYSGVFVEAEDLDKVWVEIEQGQLKE
jgi:antitoxin component YwqK of YwqJK toxin-antitoxin module